MFTAYMQQKPKHLFFLTPGEGLLNLGRASTLPTYTGGVKTASIIAGKLYSQYTAAGFSLDTGIDLQQTNATVECWILPEDIGLVVSAFGYEVYWTGVSYTLTNTAGERIELASPPQRVHLALIVSRNELTLIVGDKQETISNPLVNTSQTVTILPNGGVVDGVLIDDKASSKATVLRNEHEGRATPVFRYESDIHMDDLNHINANYMPLLTEPVTAEFSVLDLSKSLPPFADRLKYAWDATEGVQVNIDGEIVTSPFITDVEPISVVVTITGGTLYEFGVTIYEGDQITAPDPNARVALDGVTSFYPAEPVEHDAESLAVGTTTITPETTLSTVSFWTNMQNGTIAPGVTVSNGVVAGTGVWVNGEANTAVKRFGWYMVTLRGTWDAPLNITAPVARLSVSNVAFTDSQVADLYAAYFTNRTVAAPEDSMTVTEGDVFHVQSAWNVVTGG